MKTKSTIAVSLFALGAVMLMAPALASDDPMLVQGNARDIQQARVSYTDLDLRDGAAQRLLRRRVNVAANAVCNELGRKAGYASQYEIWNCSVQAYDDARPQVQAAIASALAGRQVATSIMISGPVGVH